MLADGMHKWKEIDGRSLPVACMWFLRLICGVSSGWQVMRTACEK
jgi:hypothetical protein